MIGDTVLDRSMVCVGTTTTHLGIGIAELDGDVALQLVLEAHSRLGGDEDPI